jgi:peptidoglycan/xylan/chitin deacetylase (PgdA/CDA1 family)
VGAVSTLGKEVLQRALLRDTFIWRVPDGNDCALTFDDGPDTTYTPQVLELLGRHRIEATFFLVGQAAARAPELVRLILKDGHSVASHTYSHRELPTLSAADLKRELEDCRDLIRGLTGVDTNLVRPPRGRVDARSLLRMRRWGYRLVHWSKTYSDYLHDGTGALLARIRSSGLRPRDIVLLHDNNAHTVEALGEILPEWRAHGRTFARML